MNSQPQGESSRTPQLDRKKCSMKKKSAVTQFFTLSSLMGLTLGLIVNSAPAAAGFQALSRDCAIVSPPPPTANVQFGADFFNSVTSITASKDGRTGVFFLTTNQNSTYVFKFADSINAGDIVSRKILKAMDLPIDTLIQHSINPPSILAAFNAIKQRASLVPSDNRARFNTLMSRLQNRFTVSNPPKLLMVTAFLRAYQGASSLDDAVSAPDYFRDDQQRVAFRAKFLGAARALSLPHNQRLLGYLYATDIWLGNVDRFLRPIPNLRNIFIAQGANNTPCLVAIDNEAHAPSPRYMAMINYANGKRAIVPKTTGTGGQELTLKNVANGFTFDPQVNGAAPTFETSALDRKWIAQVFANDTRVFPTVGSFVAAAGTQIQGDAAFVRPQTYLESLLHNYSDPLGSAADKIFGPAAVLDGEAFRGGNNLPINQDAPSAVNCQPNWKNNPNAMRGTSRVVRYLRTKIVLRLIRGKDNLGITFAGQPQLANGTIFDGATQMCRTRVTVNGTVVDIDWTEFDRNFYEGAAQGMSDIANDAYLQTILGPAFPGDARDPSTISVSDVSRDALKARSLFISQIASHPDLSAVDAINNQLAISPYDTQGPQFSVTPLNYKKQTTNDNLVWVPVP